MIRASAIRREALVVLAFDANAPVVAMVAYGLLRSGDPVAVLLEYPWLGLMAFAFPVALAAGELYSVRGSSLSPRVPVRLLAATAAVVLVFGLMTQLSAVADVRGLFVVLALTMAAEGLLVRVFAAQRLQRERTPRSALVIGAGWAGQAAVDCTLREPQLRIRVLGFVDDDLLKSNLQYRGIPVLGGGARLPDLAERHRVDLVISAVASPQNAELIRNVLLLRARGVEVVDMASFVEGATGQVPLWSHEGSWFLCGGGVEGFGRPLPLWTKRAFDLAGGCAALALSLPLQLLIAVLLKIDSPGPVFSREEHAGRGERPFQLLRFRTTSVSPPSGTAADAPSGPACRVSRLGRWLRLTRLDEIPQLVNVLRGEMSFVGPRPERPALVERWKSEIPFYALRFSVPPGLTGWAQVQPRCGASCTEAVEKLKYDLYYVKNRTLALDVTVLLKTLRMALGARIA